MTEIQSNDRVATPAGYAGTVGAILSPADDIPRATVTLDKDGSVEQIAVKDLTKLASRDSVQPRASQVGTLAPRAWTMGGRVD